MNIFTTAIALLSITTTGFATPVEPSTFSDGSFTIKVRKFGRRADLHPQMYLTHHMIRAYKKFGRRTGAQEIDTEELLQKRVESIVRSRRLYRRDIIGGEDVIQAKPPTAGNSLALNDQGDDIGYFAEVQIGSKKQPFGILMDTGSSDFWVPSDKCQSNSCKNHITLGAKTTTTLKTSTQAFEIQYGTGNVKGVLAQDDVSMGPLTLKALTFGVTLEESDDFLDASFDGLMGLAFQELSQQKVPTPVDELATQGLIKQKLFGVHLSRKLDNSNDGEITFGSVDQTKFKGTPVFANLLSDAEVKAAGGEAGLWQVTMDSAQVDGKKVVSSRPAIIDTGTSLLLVPDKDATAIHAGIPGSKSDGQGGFTVPCNTKNVISMSFGGQAFNIDPRDFVLDAVDDAKTECASGITGQAGVIDGNQWLVGDVFLKNVYSIYDASTKTPRVGFAASA